MRRFDAVESAIILEALDHEARQKNFNQADVLALIDKVTVLSRPPQVPSITDHAMRIKAVAEKASEAFWMSVVESYPEITTGDFQMSDSDDIMRNWIQHWVTLNTPETVVSTPPLHGSSRCWHNQFQIDEDHPLHIPEFLLRAPWEDVSWGNETCPSFWDRERKLKVWVEFDSATDRENEDASKYSVIHVDDECNWTEGLGDSLYTDDQEELEKHLDVFLTDLDLEAIDIQTQLHEEGLSGSGQQGDSIINDLGQALGDAAKALVTARRASNMIGFHVLTNRLSEMESVLDIILNFDTFYCVNCGTLGFKKTGKNTAEGWYCTASCHAQSTDR